jgi:hypothetical protein
MSEAYKVDERVLQDIISHNISYNEQNKSLKLFIYYKTKNSQIC